MTFEERFGTAATCGHCRYRRRRSRLCPAHFFDFLGFLSATGNEVGYWRSDTGGRATYIAEYLTDDVEQAPGWEAA